MLSSLGVCFRPHNWLFGHSALLTSVLLLAATGCQTNRRYVQALTSVNLPITRTAADLESRLGGIYHDPKAEQRMARVGGQLFSKAFNPALSCHLTFNLLNSSRLDAFSVPEGALYVTKAFYDRLTTDDLLAAVLAHEFAHIVAKDGLRSTSRQESQLQKELAADARASGYLARAGFDASAVVDVLRILRRCQPSARVNQRIEMLSR